MAYYQDVVVEYLREKRYIFVNTECCIQLSEGRDVQGWGPHWYCDAIAVDLKASCVYLCEVTYAKGLNALVKRLSEWNANWSLVQAALRRDSAIPTGWPIAPWIFIPAKFERSALEKLARLSPVLGTSDAMPFPRVTQLETLVPWNESRFEGLETAHSDLPQRRDKPSELDSASFTNSRLLFRSEGGAVHLAEREGRFYVLVGEAAAVEALSESDRIGVSSSRVHAFDSSEARLAYLVSRGWDRHV
jgi:hypothetical protein